MHLLTRKRFVRSSGHIMYRNTLLYRDYDEAKRQRGEISDQRVRQAPPSRGASPTASRLPAESEEQARAVASRGAGMGSRRPHEGLLSLPTFIVLISEGQLEHYGINS